MTKSAPDFSSDAVRDVYESYPEAVRDMALELRSLLYEESDALQVGPLSETLKWGQPSYVSDGPRKGTPVRFGQTKAGDVAILTHCQSTVMSDFAKLAPVDMRFDGNRATLLDPTLPIPKDSLRQLFRLALTYGQKPR